MIKVAFILAALSSVACATRDNLQVNITKMGELSIEEYSVDDHTSLFVEYGRPGEITRMEVASPGVSGGSHPPGAIEIGAAKIVLDFLMRGRFELAMRRKRKTIKSPDGFLRDSYTTGELLLHFDYQGARGPVSLLDMFVELKGRESAIQRNVIERRFGKVQSRRFFDKSGLMIVVKGETANINGFVVCPQQPLGGRKEFPIPIDSGQVDELLSRLLGQDFESKTFFRQMQIGAGKLGSI